MLKSRKLAAILAGLVLAVGSPDQGDARSLIRDAEIERSLKKMSAPILQAAGLSPSSVEIYIINDRSLNAFVAGGRRIFLHTGLMIELETPEELLGVIAHETGHIAGGHEARRAINLRNAEGPALVGLLLGIAAGVAGSSGEAAAAVAAGSQGVLRRSLLKYSRSEESAGRRLDTVPFTALDERRLDIARTVDTIADQVDASSAQVALAWVRQQGTLPILGARTLARRGEAGMLQLPGDLPTLRGEHIDALIAAHRGVPGVTLAPSRDRQGSNGVLCTPPDVLPLRFGEDSFIPHLARSLSLGLQPTVIDLPGFADDVDTPEDLARLQAGETEAEPGWNTRALLPLLPRIEPRRR